MIIELLTSLQLNMLMLEIFCYLNDINKLHFSTEHCHLSSYGQKLTILVLNFIQSPLIHNI